MDLPQAEDGREALEIAGWLEPDIILTDVKMPGMDGIAFVEKLLRMQPGVKVLFMSSYMEIPYLKSAIRLSAVDYIEKPLDIARVEEALKGILAGLKEERCMQESIRESMEMKRQTYAVMLTYPFASEDNQVLSDMLDIMQIKSEYRYFACLILESSCDLSVSAVEKLFEEESVFCACGKRKPYHYVVVFGWRKKPSMIELEKMGETCLIIPKILRIGIGGGAASGISVLFTPYARSGEKAGNYGKTDDRKRQDPRF